MSRPTARRCNCYPIASLRAEAQRSLLGERERCRGDGRGEEQRSPGNVKRRWNQQPFFRKRKCAGSAHDLDCLTAAGIEPHTEVTEKRLGYVAAKPQVGVEIQRKKVSLIAIGS